jgi:hypothetical protein
MSDSRHIRLFVSSTFRDMYAERDYLLKFTFPQLRKICESRGVVWDEVDLRWGIPDEERAEGKVLPLCLEEIRRCRPYFIGLLGERYGVPVPISADLMEREPWLAEYRECSVTELEILHGVLNDTAQARRARIYFRDPAYLDRLPADADPADFRSTDAVSAARLHDLKERLRGSGVPVRESYCDPQQLGEWIEADFGALIDELFPVDARYDPIAAAHTQFAAARQRFWVGRQWELRRLNGLIAAGPAVLVTGPAGVGISAFLANWAAAWRTAHPGTLVIEHYVGAHPGATSLDGCCRQLCLALAVGRGEPAPEVAAERDWPDLFIEQLATAAARGPVLLVVDGADRLKGRGEEAGAEWLPAELQEGVQVLASAGEEAVGEIGNRGWPVLQLSGLVLHDRAEFVRRYLGLYGKELSAERVERIATAPATGIPFYLTLLLEELRQYGNHDTLGEYLSELLAASDVFHLCNTIFARCERDYDGLAGLTEGALSFLVLARFGLSDAELCELLGGPQGRLPQRPWSMLQLALQRVLVSRDGLVGFAQSEAERVAQERYVSRPERRLELHRRLADFFLGRPDSPRAAIELPFHLQRLETWDELAAWLSRPGAFATAWRIAPEEVCRAWAAVEENSLQRAAHACASLPSDLRPAALSLLRQLGHWSDALKLASAAAAEAEAGGDTCNRLATLLTVAEIEFETGSFAKTEEVFAEAEQLAVEAHDERALLRALWGRSRALQRLMVAQKDKVTVRVELGRRVRTLLAQAMAVGEKSGDAVLRSEAMILWLEDFVGGGGSIGEIDDLADTFRSMLWVRHPGKRDLAQQAEEQFVRASKMIDGRLQQIGEAVACLRQTRHRKLALRADLALAKARDERDRFWPALEALRQHSCARDDYELLASVYKDASEEMSGEAKLELLEKQAGCLEYLGYRPELVRNWRNRSELLWLELGRRAEALSLVQRVMDEQRTLPTVRERLSFLVYRLRLALGIDDDRLSRLMRLSPWVLGPAYLWGAVRIFRWTATWFWRLPLWGCATYLVAAVLGFAGLVFIGEEFQELWRALLSRLRPFRRASDRADQQDAPDVATDIEEVERQVFSEEEPTADDPDPDVPAWVRAAMRSIGRISITIVRIDRLGRSLGLDGIPASLTWCALTLPVGIGLTIGYWRTSGCSRIWLLPFGLVGQLLALEGPFGLLQTALGKRSSKNGHVLRYACLLALIRLKRRLFRPPKRERVA